MGDKAGRWLRVSTGGQDEASQVPDIDGWCESHGYEVAESYVVHGKSAYHGKQDKYLDQAIKDMRTGKISVLVVWAADRIERRGAYNAFDLARRVKEAGGRIEYVKDSHLNSTNDMSDVMLALAATQAHQESKRKSERILAKQTALRTAGSLVGRNPYGFDITESDGIKTLVPNPSEAAIIIEAADSYLGGETLQAICDRFNESGKLPRKTKNGKQPLWSPKTLSQVLRRETIAGRRVDGSGQTVLKVAAILPRDKWEKVVKRMDERATRKGISQTDTPALLTSIIKCSNGHNMYAINSGPSYYCRKCPKGSRAMVPVADADKKFLEWVWSWGGNEPDTELKIIPSTGHQDAIDEVKRDMTEAVAAEDFDKLASLRVELGRLRSLPAEPARTVEVETGRTVREAFEALDTAGQRQYILDHGYVCIAQDNDIVVMGVGK